MTEVSCVSRCSLVVVMEDGQELPVVDAFDDNGDNCDIDDAVVCVAGPDADGLWVTIDFREMKKVPVQ